MKKFKGLMTSKKGYEVGAAIFTYLFLLLCLGAIWSPVYQARLGLTSMFCLFMAHIMFECYKEVPDEQSR